MRALSILFTVLTFYSCSLVNKKKVDRKAYNHENLKEENYDRYLLVRGKNLESVEQKLKDWGRLSKQKSVTVYTFEKAKLENWIIIKFPKELTKDYYTYHNIVYWFLGTPPEDKNYADQSIGISINKKNESIYLLYNNYDLREKLKLEDHLFGVFENSQKFILSIPFDEFKDSNSNEIQTFENLLKAEEIDIKKIKKNELSFSKFYIPFFE